VTQRVHSIRATLVKSHSPSGGLGKIMQIVADQAGVPDASAFEGQLGRSAKQTGLPKQPSFNTAIDASTYMPLATPMIWP